ncbi:Ig-like domain-containing protein [Vibrio sp. 10N.247.311.18]|uniref:Ig-like domain-containing protein n=1 Tax=Vibrio sp. 10N.247.311.18 TaxID=3229998 RepID=UPI00355334B7
MNKIISIKIISIYLFIIFLTGCNSELSEEVVKPTLTLERIDISVSSAGTRGTSKLTLAKGNKQTFIAIGHYSDHSSKVLTDLSIWRSSNENVGYFVESGKLIGKALGVLKITATKDNVTSNTVSVEVSAAVITAIAVTPPSVSVAKGQLTPLMATATYSDTTSSDVSDSVTWTSDDLSTATVTPTGFLSGVNVGQTTITAIKDGVTSNTVSVEVSAAVITAIAVTPPSSTLAKGQLTPLMATATYSDTTSSDVSDSVTWMSDDLSTATVTPTGFLSGVNVGQTMITAIKDGVTSNTVSVDVYTCSITGASCIDIFDTGSGKLFTNSPSKIALHSLGGSVNNGFTQEIGTSGPAGDFFWFTWENASRLCATYSNQGLAGRTNWRLATKNELKLELFKTYGNMFNARGWPVRSSYWSSTSRGPGFINVSLKNGNEGASMGEGELYASCVSVP